MRYILILLGLLVAGVAQAMDCQRLPDCESLGYSKAEDPNCTDNGYMYCPFDQEYKVCVQYNCAALGFTESDKTSWCADLIKCKGNPKMTLCQKPCLATDYNSLRELAESGKCRLITMKNDITIPLNQGITLAQNTALDGGGHTITARGNVENYHVFVLSDHNVLKNLNVSYTSDQNKNANFLFYAKNNTTFENVILNFAVSSSDTSGSSYMIYSENVVLRGDVNINIEAEHYVDAIMGGGLTLENADVKIISNGTNAGAEMLNWVDKFNAKNSKLTVQAPVFIAGLPPYISYILENSVIEVSDSFCWTSDSTRIPDVTLKESTFTVGGRLLAGSARNAIFRLQGTTDNPSKLIFKTSSDFGQAEVETTSTTDMVEIEDITYRPKQAGTTKLSEVPNSQNWAKEE